MNCCNLSVEGPPPTRSRRFTTMAAHHRQREPTLLGSPITGPVRQEWQPTLFDATAADYELTVYQNVDGVNTLVTPPYVASDTAYEIRVRALKGENVDKQFSLGIAYTPKWDPSGSSLLLINMQSGATNWTGSESTEKIVIKQVDIPTN